MFGVLFTLAIADTYRAPLRMREGRRCRPPIARWRLPRGPVIEVPYWSDRLAYHRGMRNTCWDRPITGSR